MCIHHFNRLRKNWWTEYPSHYILNSFTALSSKVSQCILPPYSILPLFYYPVLLLHALVGGKGAEVTVTALVTGKRTELRWELRKGQLMTHLFASGYIYIWLPWSLFLYISLDMLKIGPLWLWEVYTHVYAIVYIPTSHWKNNVPSINSQRMSSLAHLLSPYQYLYSYSCVHLLEK